MDKLKRKDRWHDGNKIKTASEGESMSRISDKDVQVAKTMREEYSQKVNDNVTQKIEEIKSRSKHTTYKV